ncbi:flagellar hook protein [Campylobacter hyointestinalis]|nr:flagellar hook protein [Campylobacter hyointestinalis]
MMIGFYNGISGVKSQGFGIDVVANNISNVNNVGFKSSTPEFKSIFYQTLAQGSTPYPFASLISPFLVNNLHIRTFDRYQKVLV